MTRSDSPTLWLRSLSALALALALGGCGADPSSCDQATAKFQACQRSLDCSTFTDPELQADCMSIKAAAATTTATAVTSCTRNTGEMAPHQLLRAGAVRFLPKPFTPQELLHAVETVLDEAGPDVA